MPSDTVEFDAPLLSSPTRRLPVGAEAQLAGGVHFRVWAPAPKTISLVTELSGRTFEQALNRGADGYCWAFVEEAAAGTRYWYHVDGELLPDPASRSQPDGPFAASQVVDARAYAWVSRQSE